MVATDGQGELWLHTRLVGAHHARLALAAQHDCWPRPGASAVGCCSPLLSPPAQGVELYRCGSLLGYCLLPVLLFSSAAVLLPARHAALCRCTRLALTSASLTQWHARVRARLRGDALVDRVRFEAAACHCAGAGGAAPACRLPLRARLQPLRAAHHRIASLACNTLLQHQSGGVDGCCAAIQYLRCHVPTPVYEQLLSSFPPSLVISALASTAGRSSQNWT